MGTHAWQCTRLWRPESTSCSSGAVHGFAIYLFLLVFTCMMWAGEGQGKPCEVGSLLPPLCGFLGLNLGHQACTEGPTESTCWPCPHLAFTYVEAGESNLGPRVCMANTLPTEPSPRPKSSTSVKFLIWSILLPWNLLENQYGV